MPALIILVVLVIAGIGLYVSYTQRLKRMRAFQAVALRLGMQYSAEDPFNIVASVPFSLFEKGRGRTAENIISGTYKDIHEVYAFDYSYYERRQSGGNMATSTRQYYRFSCAIAALSVVCPHTMIAPETLFTRMADAIGFHDIEFESEEFNRTMRVTSDDRKFANYLIDPRMMQWLIDTAGWSFELLGNRLIAYTSRMDPADVELVLQAVQGFCLLIPRVVHEEYKS